MNEKKSNKISRSDARENGCIMRKRCMREEQLNVMNGREWNKRDQRESVLSKIVS